MTELIDHIMTLSEAVRSQFAQDPDIGIKHWVDMSLPIPRPFQGTGDIRLVIIGQDPTVEDLARRRTISTVLTLNEPNSQLYRYVMTICDDLGVSLTENVYATNAAKNFFKDRPSELLKNQRIDVLAGSSAYWLPVLRTELEAFPSAVVISLGDPVLSMLVKVRSQQKVNDYWGYHRRWQQGESKPLHAIESSASTVDRKTFPIIHQPTYDRGGRAGLFYHSRWADYFAFIKEDLKYGISH